jgi:hypothetical protein
MSDNPPSCASGVQCKLSGPFGSRYAIFRQKTKQPTKSPDGRVPPSIGCGRIRACRATKMQTQDDGVRTMNLTSKSLLLSFALALSLSTQSMAQQPNWSQPGDYYPPSKGVAQQFYDQAQSQFRNGDYYAPGKSHVQRPTSAQLKRFQQGDYYAIQGRN